MTLLGALALRLALVIATPNYGPLGDVIDYQSNARAITRGDSYGPNYFAGGGPSALHPPLYSYLLAGVYEVRDLVASGISRLQAARAAQAVGGTAIVALTGLLAARLFGRRAGLIALAAAAAFPPFLLWGTTLLTESLFIFLELAGLLCVLAYRVGGEGRARWLVLAGLIAGLGILTRFNGPVLLVAFALGVWTERPRFSWKALAPPFLLAAVALATLVPWMVRNAVVLRTFVPLTTGVGFGLAGTYNDGARSNPDYPVDWTLQTPDIERLLEDPRLSQAQLDVRLRSYAWRYVTEHPGYLPEVAFWNSFHFLSLEGVANTRGGPQAHGLSDGLRRAAIVTFYVIAPVALVGAFTPAARRVPRFVWLVPLLTFASSVFVVGNARYRAPTEPFLLLLAIAAALAAWDRYRSAEGRRERRPP